MKLLFSVPISTLSPNAGAVATAVHAPWGVHQQGEAKPNDSTFDWLDAYQRLHAEELSEAQALDTAATEPPPLPALPVQPAHWQPLLHAPVPMPGNPSTTEATPLRGVEAPSVTAARLVVAAHQIAEPALPSTPPPRVWQVELPSTGTTWHLRIEQPQAQAPLALDLLVPRVMQTQAQQRLFDLDRRLRETGHDVAKSRARADGRSGLRPDKALWPLDEVPS